MECPSVYMAGVGGRAGRGSKGWSTAGGKQRETHQSFRRQAGTGSAHPRYYHNLHRSMWCPVSIDKMRDTFVYSCGMATICAVLGSTSEDNATKKSGSASDGRRVAPRASPSIPSHRPLWHHAASLAARQPAAPSSDAHAILAAVAAQPASRPGPRAAQREH